MRTERQQKSAEKKHFIGCLVHNTFGNYAGSFNTTVGWGDGEVLPHVAEILIRARACVMQASSENGRVRLGLSKKGARIHASNNILHDRTLRTVLSEYKRYGCTVEDRIEEIPWQWRHGA